MTTTRRAKPSTAAIAAALVFLASGCADRPGFTAPSDRGGPSPSMDISDGAHGAGNAGFHFLPPMVPQPVVAGDFDPTLSPVVTICALGPQGCVSTLARFSMSGPDGDRVAVLQDDTDGHYRVNWHTRSYPPDPGLVYRVTVAVAGIELGFADVQIAAGGRGLRNVGSGDFVALQDGSTLPIKFRIDRGTVYVVGANGGTLTSPDGRVTLDVPAGALASETGLTITSAPLTASQEAAAGIVGGTVYAFGPSGTQFAAGGVGLTMAYDPVRLPSGVAEADLRLYTLVNDTLYQVPGSSVDPGTHTVSGTVQHFSVYLIAGQAAAISILSPNPMPLFAGDTGTIAVGLPFSGPPWRTVSFLVKTAGMVGIAVHPTTGLVSTLVPGTAFIQVATEADTAYVQVNVLPLEFRAVTTGNLTACGFTVQRGVYCWGRNPLGIPDTNIPLRMPGSLGRRWAGIDVGFDYACAFEIPLTGPVPLGGAPVRCWGVNMTGQLGSGALSTYEATDRTVGGGMPFVLIALGNEHACAMQADGTVWCWGNDGLGELGDGAATGQSCQSWITNTATPCSPLPVRVGAAQDMRFSAVDAYYGFSCGVATAPASGVYCWGRNDLGQLGNGTTAATDAPVPVSTANLPPGVALTSVVVGQFHACALGSDGRAYCWGADFFSLLGLGGAPAPDLCGGSPCAMRPVAVSGGTTFRSLTGGRDHTCGLASGGGTYATVLCWGSNAFGQSGTGAVGGNVTTPTAITGGMQFRQIEAGRQAICGVALDPVAGRERAYCWGDASWAQAGNGTAGGGTGPRFGSPQRVALQQ